MAEMICPDCNTDSELSSYYDIDLGKECWCCTNTDCGHVFDEKLNKI